VQVNTHYRGVIRSEFSGEEEVEQSIAKRMQINTFHKTGLLIKNAERKEERGF